MDKVGSVSHEPLNYIIVIWKDRLKLMQVDKIYPGLPVRVETDVGTATLGIVRSRNAIKEYLCPLCDELIEKGEQHILAVPVIATGLRRHVHAECLSAYLEYHIDIRLHPNEPNARKYYE